MPYYNGKLYQCHPEHGKLRPCAFLPGTRINGKLAGAMVEFSAPGISGASCEIDVAPYSQVTQAYCFTGLYAANGTFRMRTTVCATLLKSGHVTIRDLGQSGCGPANSYLGAPELRYGQSIVFGPFRCTALRTATRCVVKKTGRGFFLAIHRARPI